MTRQIEDLIDVEGEKCRLRAWPLEDYWEINKKPRPDFPPSATSCHRGYQAIWQVLEGRLYVLFVMAGCRSSVTPEGKTRLSMFVDDYFDAVFPGVDDPVPADWVSGEFYTEAMDKSSAAMLTFKHGVLVSRVPCEPNDPYLKYKERRAELLAMLEHGNKKP